MAIFYDSFTEAANATLTDHVPDIGSNWTKQADNGATLGVIAASDTLKATAGGTNQGALYLANASYANNNYLVECTLTTAGQAGETIALIGRWQDNSTFYYALYSKPKACGASTGRCDICKWASGSVITLAQNLDGPVANGSVCRFEIFGTSTVRLRSYVNGVLKASADDTATDRITGIGKAGIGIGDFGIAISSGNTGAQEVDNLTIDYVNAYEASGGITFGGSATIESYTGYAASGGITFGGTATARVGHSYEASGGITFSGQTVTARVVAYATASGGITFSGSAEIDSSQRYTATGGIAFGGSADVAIVAYIDASGGIVFGGDAFDIWAPIPYFPTGGISFAGEAQTSIVHRYIASGGITFGGSHIDGIGQYEASGGITFGGSGTLDSVALSYVAGPPVFKSGMEQNRRIIVGSSGLSEDLADFPILAGALYATDSSGNDLRIYDEDGNELPYQVLIVSGSPTALGIVWVKATTWRRDRTVELHFHSKQTNVSASLENPPGVWSSYVGAYELGEDGSGQADEFFDGSPVENHGRGGAGNSCPTRIVGYLWDGQRFDGNAFIRLGDDTIEVTDPITFTCLYAKLVNSPVGTTPIYSRGRTEPIIGKGWNFQVSITAHRKLQAKVQVVVDEEWQTVTAIGSTSLVVGTTYCLHAVWEPGESLRVYIDGVLDGETESTATELVPTSAIAHIGRLDDSYLRDVDLDCIRIAKVARSDLWIQGEAKMPVLGITNQVFGVLNRALNFSGRSTQVIVANIDTSGGIILGGEAGLRVVLYAEGAGGITLSGEAQTSIVHHHVASGGIAFGGIADTYPALNYRAVGAIVFAGSASGQSVKGYTASGGITFGGTTRLQKVTAAEASGGITFGGTTQVKPVVRYAASGGLAFGGESTVLYSDQRTASGGITFAGSATTFGAKAFQGSGGITFGGNVAARVGHRYVASGGVTFGGTESHTLVPAFKATGGIAFGGGAVVQIVRTYQASGGISLGGKALMQDFNAKGGITFGGEATAFGANFHFSYEGEGGITLNPKVATRLEGSIYLATPFIGEWRIEPPHRAAIWLGTPLDGAIDII